MQDSSVTNPGPHTAAGDSPLFFTATMNAWQRKIATRCLLISLVFVAIATTPPFATVQLARLDAFVAVVQTVMCLADLLTATFLFTQYSVQPQRALLVLASGFVFSGLFALLQTFSFPDAYVAGVLIGDELNSSVWLVVWWQTLFPAAVFVYALARHVDEPRSQFRRPAWDIGIAISSVLIATAALTWIASAGFLPRLYISQTEKAPAALIALICIVFLNATAFALMFIRRRTILDQWLIVTLLAWWPNFAVVALDTVTRFTFGWYLSRLYALLAGSSLVAVLLIETLHSYKRAARANVRLRRSEKALSESEARLRLAITVGRMGIFDWNLGTGKFVWSEECYRMLGYKPREIEPGQAAWMAHIHPDDRKTAETAEITAKLEHKEFNTEYRVIRRDGIVRWVLAHGRFLYDGDKPVRMIGLKQDITEARRHSETQRVLVAELQHRTRNLMAIVQSIAHQTLDTVDSLAEFEGRFNRRLEALSRVQGLLSRAENESITLRSLLVMEFEALGLHTFGDKITLFGGPEVRLRKDAVEMFALALHELLTNAIKYGAFASETGRLSVTWRIEGMPPDQRLVLEWIERGISAVPAADPNRSGFGRTLIEQALPYSLSAETKFTLGPDRVHCRISLPLTPDDDANALAAA
jgi:PAS domain S-box-containing protein